MLRDNSQLRISLSPYEKLYEIIIPKDHILRKIKEKIDFSFVNPMLKKQYCEHFGRPAKEPEMMFKLLFLKKLYDLSDERLVSAAQIDMAYKYFLDLDPEDSMIDSSLLTKFRKTRITEKPSIEASLTEEIEYTQELLKCLKDNISECDHSVVQIYNRIKELLETEKIREIRSKNDEDAKFGHKTVNSTFYGYKSHLAEKI